MGSSVPHGELSSQLRDLRRSRQALYDSFTTWPDVLFEITDSVLCGGVRVESLPFLSLEPELRRGHGSVYAALEKAEIDTGKLRHALTGLIDREFGLVFALDASGWPRPRASTSPERTLNYDATKDTGKQLVRRSGQRTLVTPGWQFQWLAQIGPKRSSWAVPVDVQRIGPRDNGNLVACKQIRGLTDELEAHGVHEAPIITMDGGYSAPCLGQQLAGVNVQLVIRLRSDSIAFTEPPARKPGTNGRPRRHGAKMKLSNPDSWPEPDQVITLPGDQRRAPLTVTSWHNLHLKPSAQYHEDANDRSRPTNRHIVHGNLVRLHSANPGFQPLWLWWTGPRDTFDVDRVWRAYLRRFGIEHMFRFLKQHLGWTRPRLRTPAQAERWSWLIAAACAQLARARTLVTDHLLPWERRHTISPLRAKRGFRQLRTRLGTPAKPPKPSRPGPGRPKGRHNQHKAPHYPVIKKKKG